MNDGWIKLHRQILDHPRSGDPEWVSVWVHILLKATHAPIRRNFGKGEITINPGQLITSRDSLASQTGVNSSKVERILKKLESDHQIEQRSSTVSRLITIVNWDRFQRFEQPYEQRSNNDRTASEQRVNTNKNTKNERTEELQEGGEALTLFPKDAKIVATPKTPSGELNGRAVLVLTYLNEKANRRFLPRPEMLKPIMRRLMEGNSAEEIQKMIDREILIQGPTSKWLQPATLFGKNFYGQFSDRDLPVGNGRVNSPNHRAERESREMKETVRSKVIDPMKEGS